MWQCSTPSNLTVQTPHHNLSLDEDSLSDLPKLQEEETLECQEEYPQEEVEEAEEEGSIAQFLHHKESLTQGTNSSAIHHLRSLEIEQSPKLS